MSDTATTYRRCDEGVTRRGELTCCDKPAVAMRVDPDHGNPYPVCRRHVRKPMVPLVDVAGVLAGRNG